MKKNIINKLILIPFLVLSIVTNSNAILFDMTINDALCASVGAKTMNGSNFDTKECKKSDPNDTSGWYGKVQRIDNFFKDKIEYMEILKKTNIEKVRKANKALMDGKANKYNNAMAGIASAVNGYNMTIEGIKNLLKDSLLLMDCNYDCEVHNPENGANDINALKKQLSEGVINPSEIKSKKLYSMCKSIKKGCFSATLDTKKMSEKVRKELGLVKKDGSGLIQAIKNKNEKNQKWLNEKKGNYEKYMTEGPGGKLQRDIDKALNNFNNGTFGNKDGFSLWDPYAQLKSSIGSSCYSVGEVNVAVASPAIDLCNIDGKQISGALDDYGKKMREARNQVKEQAKQYMQELRQYILMTLMNQVLTSISQSQSVQSIMENIKKGQCAIQATVLAATDTESISKGQEKFTTCRKQSPVKVSSDVDGTLGGRWLTFYVPTPGGPVPVAVPSAQPTAGLGATVDTNEVGAATMDFSKCVLSGASEAVKVAYGKCMRGEDFELALSFAEDIKGFLPELDKTKSMKCSMDKEKIGEYSKSLLENELNRFKQYGTDTIEYYNDIKKYLTKEKEKKEANIKMDTFEYKNDNLYNVSANLLKEAYYKYLVNYFITNISSEINPDNFNYDLYKSYKNEMKSEAFLKINYEKDIYLNYIDKEDKKAKITFIKEEGKGIYVNKYKLWLSLKRDRFIKKAAFFKFSRFLNNLMIQSKLQLMYDNKTFNESILSSKNIEGLENKIKEKFRNILSKEKLEREKIANELNKKLFIRKNNIKFLKKKIEICEKNKDADICEIISKKYKEIKEIKY